MKRTILLLGLWLSAAGMAFGAVPAGGKPEPKDPSTEEVRNVIYMIGDGMGLAHVSMLMIENRYEPTAFDRAANVALIATYSANNRVTDSAAAGTALAAGAKTNNGTLGLDPEGRPLVSMMARATAAGRPAGVVVTCYLQHATPAAFYAHVEARGDLHAITDQMLASDIDVLLGGGRRWLAAAGDEGGSCLDGFAGRGYRVASTLEEAESVREGRLIGALAEEHLPPAPERGDYLPRATKAALEILSNDAARSGKGFVLMVEGSQIDMAAHAGDTGWLQAEMRDFDEAVAAAMDFADRTPGTLVVVTADHETGGLTMPSGDKDFTRSESGIEYRYGTGSHSGTLVPVYLYGAGAERINGVMDNTELSRRIAALLGL